MNYSAILLLLVSAASIHFVFGIDPDPELIKFYKDAKTNCMKRFNISEEAPIDLIHSNRDGEIDQVKCLVGCILEAVGIIKGNTYDWEFHQSLSRTEREKIFMGNCKGKVNEDRCELAYEIMLCFKEEHKKLKADPQEPRE